MSLPSYTFLTQLYQLPFVQTVYLYGSRARGDHQPRSDIDIAVLAPDISTQDWQRVLDIIEDADTLLPIDCVHYDMIQNQGLRYNINREKQVLYAKPNSTP